jgi:hypothetical protein
VVTKEKITVAQYLEKKY